MEFENLDSWEHSPPYPSDLTTPLSMHRILTGVSDWITYHEDWVNEEAERLGATEDEEPFLGPMLVTPSSLGNDALMRVSVPSLFRTWMTMRAVRERWDWIFRTFEEDWTSDKCVKARLLCFKVAAVALNNAFLDPETLEAKQEEELKKTKEQTYQTLKGLGLPDKLLKVMGVIHDDDEEEIDFDELFHS